MGVIRSLVVPAVSPAQHWKCSYKNDIRRQTNHEEWSHVASNTVTRREFYLNRNYTGRSLLRFSISIPFLLINKKKKKTILFVRYDDFVSVKHICLRRTSITRDCLKSSCRPRRLRNGFLFQLHTTRTHSMSFGESGN